MRGVEHIEIVSRRAGGDGDGDFSQTSLSALALRGGEMDLMSRVNVEQSSD